MVLALTGSNSLLTYMEKDAKEWLTNYYNDIARPDCRLDNFMNLYKKTKSDRFLLYENSQKFIPTLAQDWNIKKINELRNDIVHFKYGGYTIRMSDRPYQIVIDCINYINFLSFHSNNIFWEDESSKNETERLLNESKSIINSSSHS